MTARGSDDAASFPEGGIPRGAGGILLLSGLLAALWLAAAFFLAPVFPEDLPPHLSPAPFAVDGLAWGDDAVGPGAAVARAERILNRSTALLLLAIGIVGGLGYLALSGVEAVSRRAGLRVRRAVGATRRELLEGLVKRAGRDWVTAFALAALPAAILLATLGPWWAEVPSPRLLVDLRIAGVVVAGSLLWATLTFVVVQSGEIVPGGALHPDAPLAEPFRGELCHPGVPVLQVAAVTAVLVSTGILVRGADRIWAAEGPEGPGEPRSLVEFAPGEAEAGIAGLLEPGVSVTSPGFWEGIGPVRYAETECGVCFVPGSPPALVPFKGQPAVHHWVSPDTFRMANLVLVEGRIFTPEDRSGSDPVAVVSRGFAREHFQDGEAIGRRVRIGADRARWHTVVGVIEPLPRRHLPAREQPREDVLVPVAQLPPSRVEVVGSVPDDDRNAAIMAWSDRYVDLWRGAGAGGAILALLGVVLTVGRRVREEEPEIALHRALGATRRRIVARYLVFGLKLGVVGSLMGAWAALFLMGVVVPEGYGAIRVMGPVFLWPVAGMTAAAGLAAGVAARRGMTPRIREGFR